MPVYKYRSVDEMPSAQGLTTQDLEQRIRSLWARTFLLCPAYGEPGVKRFRSMQEANDDRMRMTIERMRSIAGLPRPKSRRI